MAPAIFIQPTPQKVYPLSDRHVAPLLFRMNLHLGLGLAMADITGEGSILQSPRTGAGSSSQDSGGYQGCSSKLTRSGIERQS